MSKKVTVKRGIRLIAINAAKLQAETRRLKRVLSMHRALILEADALLELYAPGTGPVLDTYLRQYKRLMGRDSAITGDDA